MQVILDFGRRLVFRQPLDIICADRPDQVPAALAGLEAALAAGHHVAGWLAYELGYALEAKFCPPSALHSGGAAMGTCPGDAPHAGEEGSRKPLLRLGVFAGPQAVAEPPSDPGGGRAWCGPLKPDWDAADYGARFRAVKDYIAAGDIYQANLSFRARFGFLGDPWTLYETLRAASDAPFCGYADDGVRQIVSVSPELFFALDADGTMTARPMKGTAPRGTDDAAARAALAASAKDRAENLMIVDLIRNDLGRVAEIGSVAVSGLFQVETYPTLHTMVSTVTAKRRAAVGPAQILRALFPCGSVTGAPKIRAMEILRELEDSRRGAYCGALGYFAPDGSAKFNVSIRTLTITGGIGELGIGGGVVQDSCEAAEYAECLLKARFYETARRPLGLIETLKWDGGFVRLEAHLARMAASAGVFGLAFDDAKARAALDMAVKQAQVRLPPVCVSTQEGEVPVAGRPPAGVASEGPRGALRGALRVRLTLDETGHGATAQGLEPNAPHWTFAVSPRPVQSGDVLLRHKTGWREPYESEVSRLGADEVIFCNERGEVCEGARSNIFVARDGVLLTPPLSCGLLPGVLRAELIARGCAREAVLTPDDLKGDLYFGNSLRGLVKGAPICPPRGQAR